MYDRTLFLADSVVQLVLSENKAGRDDAKIELSTIVARPRAAHGARRQAQLCAYQVTSVQFQPPVYRGCRTR